MNNAPRSWRLARLGGCIALASALASAAAAAAAPAQARAGDILVLSHVVASWGDNSLGDLGDGTAVSRSLYRDIAAGNDVVQVAAGRTHYLALRSDGTVWAWGRNDRGTISGGEIVPARVSVLNRVTKISAGRDFGLALRSDGIVFAWGTDALGQLNIAPPSTPVTRPVNMIAAGSRITQISAGAGHMLALKSDGTVLAWGFNIRGQLGIGSQTQTSGPVQVVGLTNATQVTAGRLSSYAVHTVLGIVGQSS